MLAGEKWRWILLSYMSGLRRAPTRARAWGCRGGWWLKTARYPWLILVPRRVGLTEIHDLKHAERMVLVEEINRASLGLKTLTSAVKINIGALGNLVPQLHIHVVSRKPGDAAWPGPVWGNGQAAAYEQGVKDGLVKQL